MSPLQRSLTNLLDLDSPIFCQEDLKLQRTSELALAQRRACAAHWTPLGVLCEARLR